MLDNAKPIYSQDGGTILCTINGVTRQISGYNIDEWSEVEAYLADHPEALVPEPEPVPPEPTPEQKAAAIRAQRNALLAQSDWTQLFDIDDATVIAWKPYRQELRDITAQAGFPDSVEWPEAPKR